MILRGNILTAAKAVFLTGVLAATISAQTFSGTGFTITDGQARVLSSCSTVNVSGITVPVVVTDVTMTNMVHAFIGDTQTMVYKPGVAPPPGFGVTVSSPPDDALCNFDGTYRYIDSAALSIDQRTTTATGTPNADCANTAFVVPPGDYRSSLYGGGVAQGTVVSMASNFGGVLTPAQANGAWLVCEFDYVAGDGGTVGGTSITLAAATAAGVTINGKATTPRGQGIANVIVSLTDQFGVTRTVKTATNGFYQFDDLEPGQAYVISLISRQYAFLDSTRVIMINDSLTEVNFVSATVPRR